MEVPCEGDTPQDVSDAKVVTATEEAPESVVAVAPKEPEKSPKVCTSGDTDDVVPSSDVVLSRQTAGGDCPPTDVTPAPTEPKEPVAKVPVTPEKRIATLEKEVHRMHRIETEKTKQCKVSEEKVRSLDKRFETLQMSNCHLAEVNSYLCQRAIQLEQSLHHMGIDPTSVGRRLKTELRNKVRLYYLPWHNV